MCDIEPIKLFSMWKFPDQMKSYNQAHRIYIAAFQHAEAKTTSRYLTLAPVSAFRFCSHYALIHFILPLGLKLSVLRNCAEYFTCKPIIIF